MDRRILAGLLAPLLLLYLALAGRPAAGLARDPADAPADTARLRREIEAVLTGYPGVAGVGVRNLATGDSLSIRGAEPFPTASLVKVALLVTVLEEVERGRLRLEEPLSMIGRDRVGGSGVLRHLGPGLQLRVEDAAWLMMVVSDNTATNLLLDKVGPVTVAETMDALGLRRTRIFRKVFHPAASSPMPDSSARYGLGVSTPDEMVALMALLHRGAAVSPAGDSLAIRILEANQDADKLVRWLPEGTVVAHKSGYDDRGRNDCGIVRTPAAPVALCVMTRENRFESYAVDNPANLLIAGVARAVFRHFNPGVPLPEAR
jgi:beta-lactamase class A